MRARVEIGVADDGKHLITSRGAWLYRFVPMVNDPTHQTILWGTEWPSYLVDWITNAWEPVLGKATALKPVSQGDLLQIKRYDNKFGGEQVTYRGWWLYIHEAAPSEAVNLPGLFERVTLDLEPLKAPDDVGDPRIPTGGP
ncbi:MAG: hypothetical protein HC933_03930 [Pleurocapsa sp. SU_196_0]|nr:hypothetical protein [Pleurocapsa sp. SU_196_0]